MIGKSIRLRRILHHESGRCVIVPYSHAVLSGPQKGLENTHVFRSTIDALNRADGIVVPMGSLRFANDLLGGRNQPAIILHADWHANARRVLPVARPLGAVGIVSPEEALSAGADGLMAYLYLGLEDSREEQAEIARIAALAEKCDRWGLPLVVESRSAAEHTGGPEAFDPKVIGLHARIAAELGADIVKCVYSGSVDSFRDVTRSCPVPVVVAGGPRKDTMDAAFSMAREAITAGAAGVMFGRNVWQADKPGDVIGGLIRIVHEGA